MAYDQTKYFMKSARNSSMQDDTLSNKKVVSIHTSVIPAKAGIQEIQAKIWIPASAGMTNGAGECAEK